MVMACECHAITKSAPSQVTQLFNLQVADKIDRIIEIPFEQIVEILLQQKTSFYATRLK